MIDSVSFHLHASWCLWTRLSEWAEMNPEPAFSHHDANKERGVNHTLRSLSCVLQALRAVTQRPATQALDADGRISMMLFRSRIRADRT